MQLNLDLEPLYNLPCHVYWKDKYGVYQGSNDYPSLIGGPSSRDIIGLSDFDLCYSDSACKFRENDQIVIDQEISLVTKEDVKFIKNNIHYCVRTHKQPLLNNEKIVGVLGMSFILSNANMMISHNDAGFEKIISDQFYENIVLTKRQKECLFLLVTGKNAKEISKQFNLSVRTIEHHIEAIKVKFNCFTRSELIAKSLKMNFIKEQLLTIIK